MRLSSADFPKLQLSIASALLMLALGAASVYLALASTRQATIAQSAAQRERNDIDGKLKRVRSEEAEIKQKSALFNSLQARGAFGEEQRLEWVELLKTNPKLQVTVLQRPFDIDSAKSLKGGDITLDDHQPRSFSLQLKRKIGS